MAKYIRKLRPEHLSVSAQTRVATARANALLQSTTFVCRCPEAAEGEHECPAFDFLQALIKKPSNERIDLKGTKSHELYHKYYQSTTSTSL